MQTLILASSSPRRKELLENLQLTFQISSSDVDESFDESLTPAEAVMDLASRKARFVSDKNPDAFVIGSDTIVAFNEHILGKPNSEKEAYDSLKLLSGNTHSVFTGVTIVLPGNKEERKFYEKTDVTFWELNDAEIEAYIKSGEPFDKAGGYGIQGFGSMLVKHISGDYFTVVGLPVSRTVRELRNTGFALPY